MSTFFDDSIQNLNKKRDGKLYFVEIGAMDGIAHDELFNHIQANPEWIGVLVEPLPDMFNKLMNNYLNRVNLSFENSAITNKSGTANISRIPIDKVGRESPDWADGISTLRPSTHIIGRYENLKSHVIKQEIKAITFAELVRKHTIQNIDLIQIDTEGYDKDIFDQVWAAGFRPDIIKFETLYMQQIIIMELQYLLATNGYTCVLENEDMIAVKIES